MTSPEQGEPPAEGSPEWLRRVERVEQLVANAKYAGQIFARRLKEVRTRRGWSQTELAMRLEDFGRPMLRQTIANLENPEHSRARHVPLEDVLAIAAVLGVAPVHMFVPLEDDTRVRLFERTIRDDEGSVVQDLGVVPAFIARAWVRGQGTVGEYNHRVFFSEMPEREREAMIEQSEKSARETGVGEPLEPEFFDPTTDEAREND